MWLVPGAGAGHSDTHWTMLRLTPGPTGPSTVSAHSSVLRTCQLITDTGTHWPLSRQARAREAQLVPGLGWLLDDSHTHRMPAPETLCPAALLGALCSLAPPRVSPGPRVCDWCGVIPGVIWALC